MNLEPSDDDHFLERILILDAAANGVFVPRAERVFDDPREKADVDYGTYDDYEDESSFDEYVAAEKDFYDSYS